MLRINKNTVVRRTAHDNIKRKLEPGKVIILYGPRRVGKTTLLKQLEEEYESSEKIKSVTGENIAIHKPLSSRSLEPLSQFVGDASLLIIDEAQLIPDIGRSLKLLVDTHPNLKIIASGSSSFDLAQEVGEPLVGRKWTVWLYPFRAKELADNSSWSDVDESLETLLVYGSYPEIVQANGYKKKEEALMELVDAHLYKDVLTLDKLRKPKIIRSLLELLAHQVGSEVSMSELGNALDIDKETVMRYLDVLEQAFVIVNLRGFSRNLRNEVTKTSKYYFYDNGARNALVGNLKDLGHRADKGALWENWLVMERIKKQRQKSPISHNYFWRTYDQKEIDWIEEREGLLFGYEFSWQEKSIRNATRSLFTDAYPGGKLDVIHRENYRKFVE